jgi:predicted transcriptional regulator
MVKSLNNGAKTHKNAAALWSSAIAGRLVRLLSETTKAKREILKLLREENKLTTKEIAGKLGKIYPQVSTYLNEMKRAGFIESSMGNGSRKTKCYGINKDYIRAVDVWIDTERASSVDAGINCTEEVQEPEDIGLGQRFS